MFRASRRRLYSPRSRGTWLRKPHLVRLAYLRPASGLNEELRRLHAGNLFSVARQLHYSEKGERSLDLALFLNGMPVFTAELKNPLTQQNVEDAIRQYRGDRAPGSRCSPTAAAWRTSPWTRSWST